MTTTSLKLEPEIKERVQRLAGARRRSPHWLMREAIEQYVVREEKKQNAWEAARVAWDEYDLTGMHLTMAEADVWLAKLEAGESLPPPECHD